MHAGSKAALLEKFSGFRVTAYVQIAMDYKSKLIQEFPFQNSKDHKLLEHKYMEKWPSNKLLAHLSLNSSSKKLKTSPNEWQKKNQIISVIKDIKITTQH